ncbi:hypothetical protein [Nocardioides limicola]|uniref:hypothetical protein n=1 Tax=Nocardioides limicola TaxID=2803368 RepID=UPI00193B04CE|nr:hypothetical protein [Nocardioides sp. DJM-14]
MRWEEHLCTLFDELEQQAGVMFAAEREAEMADRRRAEYLGVTLASRLIASVGRDVSVDLAGVGRLHGRLRHAGAQWCLLVSPAQDWVLPLASMLGVHGLSDRSTPEAAWRVSAKLGLGAALRRLGDADEVCVLHLVDGSRREGTVGRIGADFAEIVPAADPGEVPAPGLVPLAAIAAVSSKKVPL